MGGIDDLKQMLSSRSTEYGKMSQILNWYLLSVDELLKKMNALHTEVDVLRGKLAEAIARRDARGIVIKELRECLKEAADVACARCNVANGTNCDGENVMFKSCLPIKWRKAMED